MTKQPKRIMRRFKLDEISMVDVPAQEPALMTMLKRKGAKTIVTKSIGGKRYYAKDFAFVGDPSDPKTWSCLLVNEPGGKPVPARVRAAIKQFGAQRYQIPDDALDSIIDKLREAWMKAFPNRDPNAPMPPELNNDPNAQPMNGDPKAKAEEDPAAEGEEPPTNEGDEGGEEGSTGEPPFASGEEEDDEEDKKAKPKASAKAKAKKQDEEDEVTEEDNDEDDDDDETPLVDKILKGYVDASEGAMSFTEVLERCKQQDEHYEILDKAWPAISALDTSIRSIVGDPDIDTTAKHNMLRSSVETFLAVMQTIMPEVEEAIEKAYSKVQRKGESGMTKSNGDTQLEALKKQLDEATAKAARFEAIAQLSVEEKEYFDKASPADQDKFLAMNKSARSEVIAKAKVDDEVIEVDGNKLYKSKCDPAMWAFIKSQAAQTEALKKKLDEERERREEAELAKRVREEFSFLSGSDEDKIKVLKGLNALPKESREAIEATMKAANEASKLAMTRFGVTGGGTNSISKASEAAIEFEKRVAEIRKRDNVSHTEALRIARKENPEQFQAYQAAGGQVAH